jgi:membrane-bound inhibitor of C-type lysozyme
MKNFLVVLVLLVVAGVGYFLISHETQKGMSSQDATAVTFYCPDNAVLTTTFKDDSMTLTLPDARSFTLLHTMAGSGTRYEATTTDGTDIVFWSEGDNAFVTENDKSTYTNCTAATVTDSDAPGYATYPNRGKTFRFAFPTNFAVSGSAPGYTPDWSASATASGKVLARIEVPQSYLLGTNFGDAHFTVGTSADPSAVATCTANPSPTASPSTTATINGIEYQKFVWSDAAAGNRYDTTSYRVVRNDLCYAIEYTVHYGNIQNYPAGAVKEFDEKQVQSALDEIAQSFTFL